MGLQGSVSTCLLLLGISLRTRRGQAEAGGCVFPLHSVSTLLPGDADHEAQKGGRLGLVQDLQLLHGDIRRGSLSCGTPKSSCFQTDGLQ